MVFSSSLSLPVPASTAAPAITHKPLLRAINDTGEPEVELKGPPPHMSTTSFNYTVLRVPAHRRSVAPTTSPVNDARACYTRLYLLTTALPLPMELIQLIHEYATPYPCIQDTYQRYRHISVDKASCIHRCTTTIKLSQALSGRRIRRLKRWRTEGQVVSSVCIMVEVDVFKPWVKKSRLERRKDWKEKEKVRKLKEAREEEIRLMKEEGTYTEDMEMLDIDIEALEGPTMVEAQLFLELDLITSNVPFKCTTLRFPHSVTRHWALNTRTHREIWIRRPDDSQVPSLKLGRSFDEKYDQHRVEHDQHFLPPWGKLYAFLDGWNQKKEKETPQMENSIRLRWADIDQNVNKDIQVKVLGLRMAMYCY